MGFDNLVDLDSSMKQATAARRDLYAKPTLQIARPGWIVTAAACLVFLVSIGSPPRLMDDVDAVQAQAARNMLSSGDWVTARLDFRLSTRRPSAGLDRLSAAAFLGDGFDRADRERYSRS